jgi:hypothetical protein
MFSDENYFRENYFFSVFGCIPENVSKNILQCCVKDRVEGAGVRHAFLENGLQKNWT